MKKSVLFAIIAFVVAAVALAVSVSCYLSRKRELLGYDDCDCCGDDSYDADLEFCGDDDEEAEEAEESKTEE